MDWDMFDWVKAVDLTHPFSGDMPCLPGDRPAQIEPGAAVSSSEGGWRSLHLTATDHSGTHIDAPAHLLDDGPTVDRIPPDDLILKAVMIDMREHCLEDPDYRIGLSDIEQWESEHGWVPPGSAVILQTGWAFRWNDPERYLMLDEAGTMHTPGLGGDAARFLARERQVRAVGTDGPSLDVGRSSSLPAHRELLEAGCYLLENLDNLYLLPETGFMIVAAPLRIAGGTGSPCRVLALLPRRF